MPARAAAPLASTCFEIRFKPCTSVTEYIIRMSEGPTYCPTLPEATVEIITLGRPMGRRRIPGLTHAVPPAPAAELLPPVPRMRTHNCLQASSTHRPPVPPSRMAAHTD